MKSRSLLILLCGAVLLTLNGCFMTGPSNDDTAASGGSGSEIVGVVQYPDSTQNKQLAGASPRFIPLPMAPVFLLPRMFVPTPGKPVAPRVHTDSDGRFRILDVPRGRLLLEANDGRGMGIAREINVDRDSTVFTIEEPLIVQRTAAVQIDLDASLPDNFEFYMSVKGTRLITQGSKSGLSLSMGDIPTGVPHTVHIMIVRPVKKEYDTPSFVLIPGVTTIVDKITDL